MRNHVARILLSVGLLAELFMLSLMWWQREALALVKRNVPGVRLVYDVKPLTGSLISADVVKQIAEDLEEKIDRDGLHGINFIPIKGAQVAIEMPSIYGDSRDARDVSDLKRLLRGAAVLEFHVLVEDLRSAEAQMMLARLRKSGPGPEVGDTLRWFHVRNSIEPGLPLAEYSGEKYALAYITPDKSLSHDEQTPHWMVQRAYARKDEFNHSVVEFELDKAGGELFAKLTRNNRRQLLAIILDGEAISAPIVNSEIHERGVIDGGTSGFTSQETQSLVTTLNAGMLPGKLLDDPVSETQAMVQVKPDPRLLAIFIFIALVAIANAALLRYVMRRPHSSD